MHWGTLFSKAVMLDKCIRLHHGKECEKEWWCGQIHWLVFVPQVGMDVMRKIPRFFGWHASRGYVSRLQPAGNRTGYWNSLYQNWWSWWVLYLFRIQPKKRGGSHASNPTKSVPATTRGRSCVTLRIPTLMTSRLWCSNPKIRLTRCDCWWFILGICVSSCDGWPQWWNDLAHLTLRFWDKKNSLWWQNSAAIGNSNAWGV